MSESVAKLYLLGAALACLVAVWLVAGEKRRYALLRREYWRFLAAPWKLASFGVALLFFVVAAPYTGDPTWDRVDAAFMSVLAFATAPWSIGVVYRALRRQLPARQLYVALCLWLFSASFSYDAYIWATMGFHPPSWFGNLVASSVLYVSAGLMWNLVFVPGRGVVFGFMLHDWPRPVPSGATSRVLAFALVFVLLVGAMMLPFFWNG